MTDSLFVSIVVGILTGTTSLFSSSMFGTGLLIILIIMVMIAIISGRGFRVKLGKFIDIGIPPKFDYKENFELIHRIMIKVSEKTTEKIRIETHIQDRQLYIIEDYLIDIKSKFFRVFLELLKTKLASDEDLLIHKDYRSYQFLINSMFSETFRKTFKRNLIENHFADMDETKWNEYKKQKSESLVFICTEFIDTIYPGFETISKTELKIINEEKMMSEFTDIIKKIYDKAREVSIEEHQKMRNVDISLQKEIKEMLPNTDISKDLFNYKDD